MKTNDFKHGNIVAGPTIKWEVVFFFLSGLLGGEL